MVTVCVLGSSGQIGAPLTIYLRSRGYIVHEFDIQRTQEEDLRVYPNALLDDIVSKSDFVFFLAFDVGGSKYLEKNQNTFSFLDNNMKIMCNTFAVIKKHKKRFLFASSQMSKMNFSPYGVLKRAGEFYTQAAGGVVVQFWNIYGFESEPEKYHVISDFIAQGLVSENGIVRMRTDGTEKRYFLHVDDCCRALETVMLKFSDIDASTDLHIASSEPVSIGKVAETVQKLLLVETSRSVHFVPSLTRDTVQQNILYTPNKGLAHLWKPEISLDEGIKKVFTQMQKQLSNQQLRK